MVDGRDTDAPRLEGHFVRCSFPFPLTLPRLPLTLFVSLGGPRTTL